MPARRCALALLEHGAQVDARDKDGQTSVMYAVSCGNVAMLQLLIAHDAAAARPATPAPSPSFVPGLSHVMLSS